MSDQIRVCQDLRIAGLTDFPDSGIPQGIRLLFKTLSHAAYRIILGTEPRSSQVIEHAQERHCIAELRDILASSTEFQSKNHE